MKERKEQASLEYDYLKTSSSQDFTGLIPAGTADESELWDYNELFPFYPSSATEKKDNAP